MIDGGRKRGFQALLNHIRCIMDENQKLLVKCNEIKERWSYFNEKVNGESKGSLEEPGDAFDDTNSRFVWRITVTEVKEALKKMKLGKSMGLDGVPVDIWRSL